MSKETTKNYLLWGTIVIITQNALLLLIFVGTFANLNSEILEVAMTMGYWLDLIGFGLIGAGLYNLGPYYPTVLSLAQKTSHLAFGWVILSVLWRLLMGVLIPNFYILGEPNMNNLGIYATLPSTVFGAAGFALLLFVLNLDTILRYTQKQEASKARMRRLLLIYSLIHILGVIMIVIGWSSIAKIVLDPNSPSYTAIDNVVGGLFLAGIGYLIKIIVVPIVAIKAFSDLYRNFKSID
ncbi:MAG: hypothetical protein ACXABI_01830 [Candidatus Hodarchaeales archaeon]|jgi:hypothetical protein